MFKYLTIVVGIALCLSGLAQEQLHPLHGNIQLIHPNYPQGQNSEVYKTAGINDTLPFFEDFSYAPLSPFPSSAKWTDSSVFVNTGFAIAPPSIGVATFDGLNKNGYPYQLNALPNISIMADVLTSKPINLHTKKTYTWTPADSIGFSFLYQSAGFGENPETDDSLILEFYKPLEPITSGTVTTFGRWVFAWGTRGVAAPQSMDSTFKFGFVQIKDTAFFHDGFRFRFRNRATPSGSLDHWNLDYVYLNSNRTRYDTLVDEIAFAYMPRPFLKNYSAMPFKQFIPSEMAPNFANFTRSNFYDPLNPPNSVKIVTNYSYKIYDQANVLLNTYNGGACNVGYFKTVSYSSCTAHASPSAVANNFTFAPAAETEFKIVHSISTGYDFCRANDSVVQTQTFGNYYAYDDGGAEAGYYLNTYGGKAALRFTINVTDTLQALDIYFDPITQGNAIITSGFRMMVWQAGNNQPGSVYYRDSVMYPKYLSYGHNKMPRYAFTTPLILTPGTYYFGLQQTTNQQLNVGFDRNLDHSNALYYDVTGTWQPSGIRGSLMLHPIFGRSSYVIGVNEHTKQTASPLSIFPNPASDELFIVNRSSESTAVFQIYSSIGTLLKEGDLTEETTRISTNAFSSGIYFVVLKNSNGSVSQQKLIISK